MERKKRGHSQSVRRKFGDRHDNKWKHTIWIL